MRSIKRIVKIHEVNDYQVICLFNNGESRKIDFKHVFNKWNMKPSHIAYPLLDSLSAFRQFKLVDGSFVWENISFPSENDEGEIVTRFFGLDPVVLYEASEPDQTRNLPIGKLLKQTRKEQGLTQKELAQRIGTSKHYISRIENGQSGIELMTLKKIVEGMGKKLRICLE